jgi:hypothetical protein
MSALSLRGLHTFADLYVMGGWRRTSPNSTAGDFDERKTAYHVDYEIRRMGEECNAWQPEKCREKPRRCGAVVKMCGGRSVPPSLPELCPGQ